MPASAENRKRIEQRRARCWKLKQQGLGLYAIARDVGESPQLVANDLKKMMERHKAKE
jgi:hypothetical protein